MNLYEKIKNDIKESMKEKDQERLSSLRVILGEFPRLNLAAGIKPNDDQIISILRKLYKSEKSILEINKQETSIFLEVVDSYLPKLMSNEEIADFIKANIDLTQYKNIMQAMGPIMKELKGKVDGNNVKTILSNL